MNFKIVTSCFLLMPTIGRCDAYDRLLRRYESQIAQQNRQLKSLRVRLAENEKQALAWQRKSEESRQQWNRTSQEAASARERAEAVRSKWMSTRQQAETVEWDAITQTLRGRSAKEQLARWARELYVQGQLHVSVPLTSQTRWADYLTQSLTHETSLAQQQAEKSTQEQVRLRFEELRLKDQEQQRQESYARLRQEQQSFWRQWQEALRKRAALQEEKSEMEQSEQALRIMLENLREDRQRAVDTRQSDRPDDSMLASLKGTLPWPAIGKVVQPFGRFQSAEFQHLVVSNGIRLSVGSGKTIRAVQSGKVIFAAPFRQYGRMVILQHARGLTSVYAGLGETRVKDGDTLSALDALGTADADGQFYFELRRDERPLNPLAYLTPAREPELTSRRMVP